MLPTFLASLGQVLQVDTLGLMLLGVAIGFVVGVIPGLGGAVTLALMLPFTYDMEPVQVFAFLLGMLAATAEGGSITSVLFGVPGETGSAAVVLDGHPLARRGQAGRALGAVLLSSLLGAWIGALALALAVPVIRPVVMALGPPEFFALTVIGLTFVASLSGGNMLKGLVMACFGLLVATVGIDPQAGIPRYVFGQLSLWDGINIVPLVVGLFGGAEVLYIMLTRLSIAGRRSATTRVTSELRTGIGDAFRHWAVVLRSSLIGIGVGVVPGVGGSVAQFIAYGQARQSSKRPEEFGEGSIEGVIAAGAVNNAKDSGSLIPTIGFGIPGSVGTAVLLSAFLVAGLNPGEEMLTTNLDVTFSMVWIMVLANLAVVLLSFALLKPLSRLTFISGPLLVPFLLIVLTLGAYSARNNLTDIVVMILAAAVGTMAIRWDWPRVPFLLAVVLGELAERYLFLSHSLFGWGWLTRPGVLALGVVLLVVVSQPVLRRRRRSRTEVHTG